MRLPLSWLKEYIDYDKKSPQELAEIFTLLGHEVEKIEYPARVLEKVVVGKVLRIEKHPNADKLRLVETRVGNKTYKIICGGTNLREGMSVALALAGAKVKWRGQGDLVELKETEIRGVKSAGMICASAEIGLETLFPSEEENEIIDLSGLSLKDGAPLARALGIDQAILDLDITPNRADCLSVMGLARELAAALGKKSGTMNQELSTKRPKQKIHNLEPTTYNLKSKTYNLKLVVTNQKLCPKYTAQVFTNVKVGESSLLIKTRLWMSGARPINNIVDTTNYVMLETGEPMHVFDLDKLSKSKIRSLKSEVRNKTEIFIRNAKKGEKLKALDGKIYELDETMLVIADTERPVAIAGIMGGEETGITAETKNVVFEAAIFDPVSVRKTSRKLGLRSESSARFEKGIAWLLPELAQTRAFVILGPRAEESHTMTLPRVGALTYVRATPAHKPIFISQKVSAINQMLNLRLTPVKLKSILTSLGFVYSEVRSQKRLRSDLEQKFCVRSPWWRLDIKIAEDLYEEVGRIYGLNKLGATRPQGEIVLSPVNPLQRLSKAASDVVCSLGYDEVYNYSFYSRETVVKDGSSIEHEPHLQLDNPINPNQEFLRTNLLRNLLDTASRNAKNFEEVKVFEIGKVFHPKAAELQPSEQTHLALVSLSRGASIETIWRAFKGDIVFLIGKDKQAEFRESQQGLDIFLNGVWVGWMGLLSTERQSAWKINGPCMTAEFNLDAVLDVKTQPLRYSAIPEFPLVRRDIAFIIGETVPYVEVQKVLRRADPLITAIELFDLYRGQGVARGKKSLAFHITLQSLNKTLSDHEIDAVMQKLVRLLKEKFNVNVRE